MTRPTRIETHAQPPRRCPACSAEIDTVTGASFGPDDGHPIVPEPGNLSICVACEAVLMYLHDMTLWQLTADQLTRLQDTDPTLWAVLEQMRGTLRTVKGSALASVRTLALYAWVGADEHGSGVVGIKQARCPAGTIPMVAVRRDKMEQEYIQRQMQAQANLFGKTIRLVKFVFAEEVITLEPEKKGGASSG